MSYQLINLESNISLTWAYPFTGGTVVADINNVIAVGDELTMTLPPANLVSTGQSIIFNNIGNVAFTIAEYGSIKPVVTMSAGQIYLIYLTESTTAAGLWQPIPFGGGTSAITSITATSPDPSLLITNGTINSPGGNINFSLSESLINLNDLNNSGEPGFLVITAGDPLKWNTCHLAAGTNIAIANSGGAAGNPIINLSQELRGLTEVQVTNNAGNIVEVAPKGITITDSSGNTCTVNSTGVATNNSTGNPIPSNAAAWLCFSDTGSGCTSAIVIQSSYNIAPTAGVVGASGVYTVTFTKPFTANTYAVLTSLQRQGSNLMPFQAFVQSKQNGSFVVVCTDTLGNLLAPYDGMSVVVFSN